MTARYLPGYLLITFKEDVASDKAEAIIKFYNLQILSVVPDVIYLVEVPAGKEKELRDKIATEQGEFVLEVEFNCHYASTQ